MKASFITTVFNEELTIEKFISSLLNQTKLPNEIIIVDAMSNDKTINKIKKYEPEIKRKKIKFKLLVKKGNRSIGRNEAVNNADGDIILCSDAGNILDKDWVKNITKPFTDKTIDVVAGYYIPVTQNIFQKCLSTYTCVMPDKIDGNNFLPSSRSVAFKKNAWKKAGGYPEYLNTCEDLVFAQKMKEKKLKFSFAKDAIVYWPQKKNLKDAFFQLLNYAKGDGEALFIRNQTFLLFSRYILGIHLIFLSVLYKSILGFAIIILLIFLYLLWSIKKNYKYVKHPDAITILPKLQFTADAAVLLGTSIGSLKKLAKYNYLLFLKKNKFLIFILFVYTFIVLSTLKWGIPNQNHPFPYHMDEWHQFHAVGTTFIAGTPNTAGSANGTMFHFLTSGLYLSPFILFKVINPLQLTISDYLARERIFEILRLNTLFYGVLSIITLYCVTKLSNAAVKLTITLFALAPIWISLSGYFKYDIALIFWINLSLLFFLLFIRNPTNRNYLLAAIPASLAVAVKISAMPLFIVYIFLFFFHSSWKKNLRYYFLGIVIFFSMIVLFGMPDTLFGKGNISLYFFENVILVGNNSQIFQLGMDPYKYLLIREYPLIFGHGLFGLSLIFLVYLLFSSLKDLIKKRTNTTELFLILTFFVFLLSLIPLGIFAGANRSLVLLPFLALITGIGYKKMEKVLNKKVWFIGLITIIVVIQLYESFAWYYIKLAKSPQELASTWIQNNISQNETIGLENIPIYQAIPDILQKEFYFKQYGISQKYLYKYTIIDYKSKELPSVIVITNGEFETNTFKNSPKKRLLKKLKKEGYKEVATFYPDFRFYKYFGNKQDYVFAGIVVTPSSIAIYKK